MMRELASGEATLIVDVSADEFAAFSFTAVPGVTTSGEQTKRVTMPLTAGTLGAAIQAMTAARRSVCRARAIEIRVRNERQFNVGDYFHRECVSTGPLIRPRFLQRLKDQGIIRAFYTGAQPPPDRADAT
jgi:hypothetical protein